MDNAVTLKKHNFDVAKSKIQTLAHTVPATVSLKQFPTSGSIFSWNNHDITGKEANELLVSPLQTTLIAQNSRIKDLFNIADEVYKTFDYLDKEYIQGIVVSVEAAKIASNQAKSASDKAQTASDRAYTASQQALTASNKANEAQADIKKTIEALKATVTTLKTFKERVSTQIDSISSTLNSKKSKIQSVENKTAEFSTLSLKIGGLTEQYKALSDSFSRTKEDIKFLTDCITSIESDTNYIAHQKFKEEIQSQKVDLFELHQQLESYVSKIDGATNNIKEDIALLYLQQNKLDSYAHLSDIDIIWDDVVSIGQRISNLDKSMSESLASNVATIGSNMAVLQQKVETQMADDKANLEQSILELQQTAEAKLNELSTTEQQHKSEIEQT
ncbi:MAG: hypothetical protein EOM31_11205, partial [Bacteroidia bacterium]|nr:hypothetical protein [Bacteroidia bacterium]